MADPETPSTAPVPAEQPAPPERPQTLAQVREQITALKEKMSNQQDVTQAEIDALKADFEGLPEDERKKVDDETKGFLDQLRDDANLQANLIALETNLQKLERGLAQRGLGAAGEVVGQGADWVGESVVSAKDRALDRATWSQMVPESGLGKALLAGSVGFGLYRLIRYFSKGGGVHKDKWYWKMAKLTGVVALATFAFNHFGAKAEARAAEFESRDKEEKAAAEAFAQALGGSSLELFGNDANAQKMATESVNLTHVNKPVTVAGHSLQFSRGADGKILWTLDGRNLRASTGRNVTAPNSWLEANIADASSISRVPNSTLVRFRVGGKELYVEQDQFESLVTALAASTTNSTQTVLVMGDMTKPDQKHSLALNFELVQAAPTA